MQVSGLEQAAGTSDDWPDTDLLESFLGEEDLFEQQAYEATADECFFEPILTSAWADPVPGIPARSRHEDLYVLVRSLRI